MCVSVCVFECASAFGYACVCECLSVCGACLWCVLAVRLCCVCGEFLVSFGSEFAWRVSVLSFISEFYWCVSVASFCAEFLLEFCGKFLA